MGPTITRWTSRRRPAPRSRWHTELDGGPVDYGDRAAADRALLTYTSDPLGDDVEITGDPELALWLRSTAADGALHVYLETVDPRDVVRHLVEGGLRARDRKISTAPYATSGVYHSHRRADAAPLPVGQAVELRFALYPISVCVPKGDRVRVAIAGADAGLYARVPERDGATITVERTRERPVGDRAPGSPLRGVPLGAVTLRARASVHRRMPHMTPLVALLFAGPLGGTPAQGQGDTLAVQVDAVMAEWSRPGSPGCAVGVVAGRRGRPGQGLRPGRPGARRPHRRRLRLRHRLDVQAVHRGGRRAPGPGGQALARRRRPPVRAGAAALRGADHDAAPAAPHERAARLPGLMALAGWQWRTGRPRSRRWPRSSGRRS